ncbi:MAG: ABC transporter permease [Candidatus Diapherotrites archaeon]
MKLKDSFQLSLNNILHRQLRAWLTLLGIIIGVAAVVSIVSIGQGASASVTENFSSFGADILTITPGFSRAGSFGGGGRGSPGMSFNTDSATSTDEPELGKLDLVVIKGNPNVQYANEIVSGRGELVFLAEKITASIQGVNPVAWPETDNIELDSGRLLGASDSSAVVIGYRIANEVFKQPITVGRRITIEDQPFTVVGILAEGNNDSTVFMHYSSAWEVTDVEKNTYSSIEAKVENEEIIDETADEITAALMLSRKVTERDQDFSVRSPTAMQEQINEVLGTLTLFLAAIAAVSLVVGAVGIANSMFTSVLEKTKEIGIMKALGSTEREIMELFVIESGLFGFIGGGIGVIFGMTGSILLSLLVGLNTLVSIELMAIAMLLSTVIGVVSGLLPARAASKLKPIEALRYE